MHDESKMIQNTAALLKRHNPTIGVAALQSAAEALVKRGAVALDENGAPYVYDESKAGGSFGFALRTIDRFGALAAPEPSADPIERTLADLRRQGLDPVAAINGWDSAASDAPADGLDDGGAAPDPAESFDDRIARTIADLETRGIDPMRALHGVA